MKNGAPMHNQQVHKISNKLLITIFIHTTIQIKNILLKLLWQNNPEKSKDLRSRGLCLVPVSSTFPVTHETSVDFWTPTFGGTFR